jgi:hypothetical protein
MSKTIHFNTGRKYTVNGQRITATLHDDGIVTFYDHDRHVDGEFNPEGLEFTQAEVMRWYDTYCAPNTSRSWGDAFTLGGCNSRYEG